MVSKEKIMLAPGLDKLVSLSHINLVTPDLDTICLLKSYNLKHIFSCLLERYLEEKCGLCCIGENPTCCLNESHPYTTNIRQLRYKLATHISVFGIDDV